MVSPFWTASLAFFSILSAAFSGASLSIATISGASLSHSPTLALGFVILLAGAGYGAVEVFHRLRRHPPRISPPLSTHFVFAVLLSGGLLVVNGLLARRHSADTRAIEELRVVDDTITKPAQELTPKSR